MADNAGDSPSELPSVAQELSSPALRKSPIHDFDDDHKRRYHEATVRQIEVQAKQADDDREMRREIAERVFLAISVQVVIADVAFLIYGFWNKWGIPAPAIEAWLGAVVVQVIAVGLVIARSLFPSSLSAT